MDAVVGGEAWFAWMTVGAGSGAFAGAAGRALLGRLRRGTHIPPPWCELLVGGLWAVVAGGAGSGQVPLAWVPVLAGAAWLAVVAGVVDVRHHRLPDALTLPALPAALVLVAPLGWAAVARGAAGALVLAAVHLLVHAVSPRALGLGDVKLAAPVGAVLAAGSWSALVLGCALSALVSGLLGAVLGLRRLRRTRRGVPARAGRADPRGRSARSPDPAGVTASARPPTPPPGGAARRGGSSAPAPGGGGWVPAPAPRGGERVASARVAGVWRARPAARAPAPCEPSGGEPDGIWRAELPHGPSMLAAAWLTTAAAAVGAGLTGPLGAVAGG